MVLMTKNRTLLRLVRVAYERAPVKADEVLIVWSTRIYLDDQLLVMESACPIYLERVVEQLRIFTGEKPKPPGYFLWVRAVGNPARRWRPARKEAARHLRPRRPPRRGDEGHRHPARHLLDLPLPLARLL